MEVKRRISLSIQINNNYYHFQVKIRINRSSLAFTQALSLLYRPNYVMDVVIGNIVGLILSFAAVSIFRVAQVIGLLLFLL